MKHQTFLDKEIGFNFITQERTITEKDLLTFYDLWEEKEDLFSNDRFAGAADLSFKGKIVPAYYLISGMLGKLDVPSLGGGFSFNAVLLEMNNVKFLSAAYEGNKLRAKGELLEKRTTSKGHVIAVWKWALVNQNDQVIVTGTNIELFSKFLEY